MNMIIKNRNLKGEMTFYSDIYCEREQINDNYIKDLIKGLLTENKAVMFSWYSDTKRKLIIYPYKDKYGDMRAGYFENNRPTRHTNDIDRAIAGIVGTSWEYDIYIKVA